MKYIGNTTVVLNQAMIEDIMTDAINSTLQPGAGRIKVKDFRAKPINNCPSYEVTFEPVEDKKPA